MVWACELSKSGVKDREMEEAVRSSEHRRIRDLGLRNEWEFEGIKALKTSKLPSLRQRSRLSVHIR